MTSKHRSNPGSGSGPPRYPGSFLLAFREAIDRLGWRVKRWLGDAVECSDAQDREQVIGLENLYRRARRTDRTDWPELIVDFLQTGQQAPIDDPPEDLGAVADQLLCRLGPPMTIRGDGPGVWQQAIEGTGLVICLVIDFARSMFYVTEEMIEKSGKPGEHWLAQAILNLQKQTSADSFTILHQESGLRQCNVGDAYDSSRVLLLDALLPESQHYGHLVALPGRDELLMMPVTAESLQLLPMLKAVADKSYRNAPYPISNEVYWIKNGQWHAFAIEARNNQVNIQPPEEFLPILKESLPGVGEKDEPGETEVPQAEDH